MIKKIKANFKQKQKLRIAYRQFYHIWRRISVLLLDFYLKQTKFKTITRKDLLTKKQQV